MLSAAFKYAVINEIKLNSCSLPVHNEQYVISFHNLVVPAQVQRRILKAKMKYPKLEGENQGSRNYSLS
jgi:hypothetical protein